MTEHLIFYDATCPLCQNAIKKIQARDTHNLFSYHPLTSDLARKTLSKELLSSDTLVFLENGKKAWIRSKALFRIMALLGGRTRWLGVFTHVPGLDWCYRLFARHRHRC